MKKSFTLIELLIVLIIIAVLTVIAIPAFQSITLNSYGAEAKTNLNALYNALTNYYEETARIPPTQPSKAIPPELGIEVINTSYMAYTYDYIPLSGDILITANYLYHGLSGPKLPVGATRAYVLSLMTGNNPSRNLSKAFGPYYRGNFKMVYTGNDNYEWQFTW